MCRYLDDLEMDTQRAPRFQRKLLCRTIAGNRLELLTITSAVKNPEEYAKKRGIVITARVHPGETVSSFIMQGVIDFLLSDNPEALLLCERFIFKIIPMLNPDGVIHGNYRCSLAGCDLNRRWKTPCKQLHPEIYHTKKMIINFQKRNELVLLMDLHGHSRKKNIFCYGCFNKDKPMACKEFPFLLSKMHQYFSFKDCNFQVQKSKEGTARISMWKELGRIPNVFTLESSFCGPNREDIHFSISDLEMMGQKICEAALV